ncbi:MAG: cyclic nucleotide-binding [Rhodospirillales bacterium]|nr:cyclic nucleotide-binding [Rhodospirillales bacterium]
MRRLTADIFDDGVISRASLVYRTVEASFAIAGVGAMVLDTEPDLPPGWSTACLAVDIVVLGFFVLDWLTRLWVIPLSVDGISAASARMRWLTSRASIIGLLSFVPMGLAAFIDWSATGAPVLSILWVVRFAHYSKGIDMLFAVFARERQAITAVLFMFLTTLLTGGVLEFLVERGAQPDHFRSVPQTLWWAITTLTTTGYGDMVPTTSLGRLVAGGLMISGLIVFGLLAGILATGFAAEMKRRDFLRNWDLVAQVPIFRDVGPGTIADLANLLRPRELPGRTVVARRGSAGDCMFFIVSGEVEIQVDPVPVRLGAGEFFGEMALVTGATRNATVVTRGATRLLVLDIADFRAFASAKPELLDIIQQEAGRRSTVAAGSA